MNFLIFDTETTGFPVKGVAASHPSQARIVQLAWLLLDDKFVEWDTYNRLFKLSPKTKIHPGAQAAHKKTWEMCNEMGIEPSRGMEHFYEAFNKASLVIAHNYNFDIQLLQIEDAILNGPAVTRLHSQIPSYCTMEATTPICRLPARFRGTSYKWPKLQEAYKHCFGKEFDGAHDALADVRATAQVFKWLVDNGHYKLPTPICQTQIPSLQSTQTTLTV